MPQVSTVGMAVAGSLIAAAMSLGWFASMYPRHRLMKRGNRVTAVVVSVRPTKLWQQHSLIERPTEQVTVTVDGCLQPILVDQKLPAGQYAVGQPALAVQDPSNLCNVLLDRPDLEPSSFAVYAPLRLLAAVPIILYLAAMRG